MLSFLKVKKTPKQFVAAQPDNPVIRKGALAQELLDNPLFMEILDRSKAQIISDWENSPHRDSEGREFLFYRMEAIKKVERMITGYVNDALVEEDQRKNSPSGDAVREEN